MTQLTSGTEMVRARSLDNYLNSVGRKVHRYGNASHAFKDVLGYLARKCGAARPNVIMPAFIPAKLYRTVVAAGYEPKFYDIREGCTFDPQEVEDLVDDQTTSIFVIHYFGRPADIESISETAKWNRVALIEDCAHVLLGSAHGKILGTFGDFSIFSPRKMLHLSDGGLLLMNKPYHDFRPTRGRRVRSSYSFLNFIASRLRNSYLRLANGNDFFRLTRPTRVGWLDPGRPLELSIKRMSYFTALVAKTADLSKNCTVRRENYSKLFERLREFGYLEPVYEDLPVNWTPYSLPMILNKPERTTLQIELLRRGISCGLGWPESPFSEGLSGTRTLAERLIEFPIHPLMVEKQFDQIVMACKAFDESGTAGRKAYSRSRSTRTFDKHSSPPVVSSLPRSDLPPFGGGEGLPMC